MLVNIKIRTSFAEVSPQFTVERMAFNIPIVASNVGDIQWLFGKKPGHFLTTFEPEDVAQKITLTLQFAETNKHTSGRKRLMALNLDSDTVAGKIIEVYNRITKNT